MQAEKEVGCDAQGVALHYHAYYLKFYCARCLEEIDALDPYDGKEAGEP